jgi:K+-sensing histidine kinase KdpD
MRKINWEHLLGGKPGLILIITLVVTSIIISFTNLFDFQNFIPKKATQIEWVKIVIDLAIILIFGLLSIALIRLFEIKRRKTEQALQQQTRNLGERVKELNCLYGISNLLAKHDLPLDDILRKTVYLILPALQYPESACARIVLNDQGFCTENFRETTWKQSVEIWAAGSPIGTLEVCYLEEKPEADEGPFLREEINLLSAIAERLGKITDRKKAMEELSVLRKQIEFILGATKTGLDITTLSST